MAVIKVPFHLKYLNPEITFQYRIQYDSVINQRANKSKSKTYQNPIDFSIFNLMRVITASNGILVFSYRVKTV